MAERGSTVITGGIGIIAIVLVAAFIAADRNGDRDLVASVGEQYRESDSGDTVTNAVTSTMTPSVTTNVTTSPISSPLNQTSEVHVAAVTPSDDPQHSESPLISETPLPVATRTQSPSPTQDIVPEEVISTPTPIQSQPVADVSPRVVFNEIGWMGTSANSADEWLELYNDGDGTVDLSGWKIAAADGAPSISLSGVIAPGGYFLIERTDDATTSVPAGWFGSFGKSGSIENGGEDITLTDSYGTEIDSIPCGSGWFAGSASPGYFSMERRSAQAESTDASNWATNDGVTRNGEDVDGNPINGTPGHRNSVSVD